jgi:hypothetical protein
MQPERKYWFPAKRNGWGWGPPTNWRGWVVMALFALLLLIGAMKLLPGQTGAFLAYAIFLCIALAAVCWFKGEPAGWRSRIE